MKPPTRPPVPIPEPKELTLKPSDYQPSKAELEEEHDMPGLSMKEVCDVVFRPYRIVRDKSVSR